VTPPDLAMATLAKTAPDYGLTEERALHLSNPYESPEPSVIVPSGILQKVHATRMRAALAGMWRGAKLGFWTFCFIFWTCVFVALVVAAFIPELRREMALGTTAAEIAISIGKDLFVLFVVIPLSSVLYGSFPGGLIMGFAAAIRWRPPTDFENPTTLVS
jgi:hypothetical protein